MRKFLFLLAVISVVSCNKKSNEFDVKQKAEKTSLMVKANAFFKSITSLPYEDIPDDKVALGKKLYFDTRLSKDGSISCNSCHNLNTFGVDNLPTSPGDTKMFGDRNSPTVIYASLHSNQFWDGRAKDVEEQAGMPILNPVEHNIPSEDFLVARLKEIPEYVAMFKKVYSDQQDPITYDNLTNAIGAFERKLIPISRFDLWLDGDDQSLTEVEKKGLNAFIDNGCIACHSGVALGGNTMQKFGLYGDYWEHTNSKKIDMGLYDITKNEADKYVFKSPGMRNIAKTYPYFHDGSVESLYDAVKIMGLLQSNIVLTDEDTKNIVAFLEALTADVDEIYKE